VSARTSSYLPSVEKREKTEGVYVRRVPSSRITVAFSSATQVDVRLMNWMREEGKEHATKMREKEGRCMF
jgi:hypothetical protein